MTSGAEADCTLLSWGQKSVNLRIKIPWLTSTIKCGKGCPFGVGNHVTRAEKVQHYLGWRGSTNDTSWCRTPPLHGSDAPQHQFRVATRARRAIGVHRRTVHRLLHLTHAAKSLLRWQQWVFVIVVLGIVVMRTEEEIPVQASNFVQPLFRDELVS